MEVFTLLGLFLLLILVPVKVAGNYLGAQRTGFGWCFLAVIIASSLMKMGEELMVYGSVLSIFLSAIGFSLVMGTTYFKGLGIAVFQLLAIVICILLIGYLDMDSVNSVVKFKVDTTGSE